MMRNALALSTVLLALLLGACSQSPQRDSTAPPAGGSTSPTNEQQRSAPRAGNDGSPGAKTDASTSVDAADKAQASTAAAERKIIKNATLVLEVAQPQTAQQKITAIAEAKGGFVVSTDVQRQTGEGQDTAAVTVTVIARVPATQFDAAVTDIRATATRVREEKQTGQDVTEEFIDLDARLRTKQALETQYLEIMKQAHTVTEAIEVQNALATVRGEIEQIQGRMRFLQNQSDLSTITVTLTQPTPFLGTTTGFWASVKSAFSDGVWVASAILLFLIRAAVALAPVVVLIFLPIGLLLWYIQRRWRRAWTARKLAKLEMERAVEAEKAHDA